MVSDIFYFHPDPWGKNPFRGAYFQMDCLNHQLDNLMRWGLFSGGMGCSSFPIGSMYGIFINIWLIFMANVGKYTIHGSYGSLRSVFFSLYLCIAAPPTSEMRKTFGWPSYTHPSGPEKEPSPNHLFTGFLLKKHGILFPSKVPDVFGLF